MTSFLRLGCCWRGWVRLCLATAVVVLVHLSVEVGGQAAVASPVRGEWAGSHVYIDQSMRRNSDPSCQAKVSFESAASGQVQVSVMNTGCHGNQTLSCQYQQCPTCTFGCGFDLTATNSSLVGSIYPNDSHTGWIKASSGYAFAGYIRYYGLLILYLFPNSGYTPLISIDCLLAGAGGSLQQQVLGRCDGPYVGQHYCNNYQYNCGLTGVNIYLLTPVSRDAACFSDTACLDQLYCIQPPFNASMNYTASNPCYCHYMRMPGYVPSDLNFADFIGNDCDCDQSHSGSLVQCPISHTTLFILFGTVGGCLALLAAILYWRRGSEGSRRRDQDTVQDARRGGPAAYTPLLRT